MTKDGTVVPLTPKAFDLLLLLLENGGALVEKSRLMSEIWPETFVEENTLTRNIADLRKALGKGPDGQQWIETVPKFGYRFVAPVTVSQTSGQGNAALLRRPVRLWIVAGAVAAMGLVVATWVARTHAGNVHAKAQRLTAESELALDAALSAGGDRIAYASDRAPDGGLDIWVRALAGGEPLRLTRHPADDREPAISPDGRLVAFHSERDGGGLYVVATEGGVERRIADLGRGPQFSPDGRLIAYWVGDIPNGVARVYVVASGGGTPRRIDGACGFAAGSPVWSPDGKHLLFWCKSYIKDSVARGKDWWVARTEGGGEVQTGSFETLTSQGLLPDYEVFTPSAWTGNQIVFAAAVGGNTSMWRVPIEPETWRVTGRAERLTFTDNTVNKASAARGTHGEVRLAFAGVTESSDIWSLPVDVNRGEVTGEIRRLTNDPAGIDRPSVSTDGRQMVYCSYRTGSRTLWTKDLQSGVEWPISGNARLSLQPFISPDGSQVAYAVLEGENRVFHLASLAYNAQHAPPRRLCENCGRLWGWSQDGKSIFFNPGYDNWNGKYNIGVLDVASLRTRVGATDMELTQMNMSPDGAWMAFCVVNKPDTRQMFISRFHDGLTEGPRIRPSADWITVTPGNAVDTTPVWSPDGKLLYYLSPRDGGLCIWVQRLDGATKRPLGSPWAVHHMHQPSRGVKELMEESRIGLSLAGGQLIFAQAERSGSIWMTTFPPR